MLNIVLVFYDILKSYLVNIYLLILAVSGITHCYKYHVTMAKKQVLITLLLEGIRASYLVHTFLEATSIFVITCCYGYLVTMATEAGAFNIAF